MELHGKCNVCYEWQSDFQYIYGLCGKILAASQAFKTLRELNFRCMLHSAAIMCIELGVDDLQSGLTQNLNMCCIFYMIRTICAYQKCICPSPLMFSILSTHNVAISVTLFRQSTPSLHFFKFRPTLKHPGDMQSTQPGAVRIR